MPVAVLILGLAGCHQVPPSAVQAPEPVNVFAPELPPPPVNIDHILDSLSLQDRIAQLVMPWIPGTYSAFDDDAFAKLQGWVDSLHVGGIIVSIGSPLDVAARLNRLQERSALPLLMAADLEGGTAFRLTGGTAFPTNMGVAATGREQDAYEMGRITALEGRAVGIHLAFAPDADVNNNPANPIINTRSFGEDPAAVAQLVAAEVHGLQDHGMLATVKHFPGHGDTETDSHLSLPVISSGWERLNAVELVPFRAAIEAGVAVVMSAHIAMPGIDSGALRPATLSPEILTGVLRDSLHFRGLAVTDALTMGGIVAAYGPGEAAVQAFLAGSDLLLMPVDPRLAIDAMIAAVGAGRISEARLNLSVRRLLALKRGLGLFRRRSVPLDSVPFVVGQRAFTAQARDVAQRSIVLVADSLGWIDSLRDRARSITLITYGDENNPNVGTVLAAELRNAGRTVSLFKLWPASGPASLDSARAAIGKNGLTLFAAAIRTSAGRGTIALPDAVAALIDETARRRPAVLVSLGSPYLLSQTPHISSYLLGWSANPNSEWAVARALTGQADIGGHLPISLPPLYPAGYGLQRVVPDTAANYLP